MWEKTTRVLKGEIVRLEPLAWHHEEGLFRASKQEEIWRWMQYGAERSREEFRRWIGTAISRSEAGMEGAFATLDARTGEPIGSTRFLALRPEHRGLEIGWTWLTPSPGSSTASKTSRTTSSCGSSSTDPRGKTRRGEHEPGDACRLRALRKRPVLGRRRLYLQLRVHVLRGLRGRYGARLRQLRRRLVRRPRRETA